MRFVSAFITDAATLTEPLLRVNLDARLSDITVGSTCA
jgi:hypothetical protein